MLEKPTRAITLKPPARKSTRKRAQLDYASLNAGVVESDPTRWLRVIQSKPIKLEDGFRRMTGVEVGIEWLESDPDAMREPIVIESPDGLGMKMPDPDFTVTDVANMVGRETAVEVIGTYGGPLVFFVVFIRSRVRRRHAVQLFGVDARKMGRLLQSRARLERQDQERHLSRDLWYPVGRPGLAPEARKGVGLGGEVLAPRSQGKGSAISKGPAILSDGRRFRVDGASSSHGSIPTLMTLQGLAHRFRGFLGILSYSSWKQGRPFLTVVRPELIARVRSFTSSDRRQPISLLTNDGLEQNYSPTYGWATWSTK